MLETYESRQRFTTQIGNFFPGSLEIEPSIQISRDRSMMKLRMSTIIRAPKIKLARAPGARQAKYILKNQYILGNFHMVRDFFPSLSLMPLFNV